MRADAKARIVSDEGIYERLYVPFQKISYFFTDGFSLNLKSSRREISLARSRFQKPRQLCRVFESSTPKHHTVMFLRSR